MKKITLKDYYEDLSTVSPKDNFRDKVIAETRASRPTFYYWMRNIDKIPGYARKVICEITGRKENELFQSN